MPTFTEGCFTCTHPRTDSAGMSRAIHLEALDTDVYEVAIETIGTDDVLEPFKCTATAVTAHAGILVSSAGPPEYEVLVGYRSAGRLLH